jgi:uncharacterized iron-regulated membrane protein
MAASVSVPILIRKIHRYAGVFFAPAILFFALTGVLQVFELHETKDGVRPPALLLQTANLHKHQMANPPRKAKPPASASAAAAKPTPPQPAPPRPRSQFYLKLFAGLTSIVLALSTVTGLYLALRFGRDRKVVLAILAAGVLIPAGLLLL